MHSFSIHPHLLSIATPYKGILLDAYGVFWGGNSLGILPGSKLAMQNLIQNGKIVGILSNSTQLAAKEIEKLQAHNIMLGIHFHFLITSGEVAKNVFSSATLPFPTLKKKFWLFGEHHPKYSSSHLLFENSAFTETATLEDADFIYLSIPHINGEDQLHPHVFSEKVKQLSKSGLPMVCANPDSFAHEGNPPRRVVRQGSIAALYEEMGGRVFYIGKPSRLVFEKAMQDFYQHSAKLHPSDILMVGDTPETDIRGAKKFGMASALVTKTGIMAERISENGYESLNLKPLDSPDFFIERLGLL